MVQERTQVGIVGAGPAGLALALLLHEQGIESVVLECRDREYVEHRVRAGLLEHNTVELLRGLGVAERLDREGLVHDGIFLRRQGRTRHVPMTELTGRHVTIYGQQEVVKDLIAARLERGGPLRFEVSDVALHDLDDGSAAHHLRARRRRARTATATSSPAATASTASARAAIPDGVLTEHEFTYPFGWLGILAEAAPTTDELIYAWHERGFALYSMRSPTVSRLYLQVPADEDIEAWPDDRIWDELQDRLAAPDWRVGEGRIFEKGITPMRSFVCEPLRFGRLFLAGDAAHIVPPTGAKGLNLAVNDVRLLAAGAHRPVARRRPERRRRLLGRRPAPGLARAGLLQLHDPAAA